jgi:hypothetical protein
MAKIELDRERLVFEEKRLELDKLRMEKQDSRMDTMLELLINLELPKRD